MLVFKLRNGTFCFGENFWDNVFENNPGWTLEDDLRPRLLNFLSELEATDELTASRILELATRHFNVSVRLTRKEAIEEGS